MSGRYLNEHPGWAAVWYFALGSLFAASLILALSLLLPLVL